MSEYDDMDFDLTLQEINVTLNDPDTKEKKRYILRELTGDERDSWLQEMSARTGKHPDGSPKVKNFKGLQASLLKFCLLTEEREKVGVEKIQKWPARVQSKLFEKAQELSGLDQGAEDEAGND